MSRKSSIPARRSAAHAPMPENPAPTTATSIMRRSCLVRAHPRIDLLPLLVEPRRARLVALRHLGGRDAPERRPDPRADEPAAPDVADVLQPVEPDVRAEDDID